MTDHATLPAEGMEEPDRTALGFGGKTIDRQLRIGDELYLLMRCDVVSDGRKQADEKIRYTAGARTKIIAELTAGEATRLAAQHGWSIDVDDDDEEAGEE